MSTLEDEVRQQQLRLEASKINTAPLLRKGWTYVFSGWALSFIPLLGMLGWFIAMGSGIIIGILAITRGNTGGGLTLLLCGWLGTIVVALFSLLFWMLFGISGFGFLAGIF